MLHVAIFKGDFYRDILQQQNFVKKSFTNGSRHEHQFWWHFLRLKIVVPYNMTFMVLLRRSYTGRVLIWIFKTTF